MTKVSLAPALSLILGLSTLAGCAAINNNDGILAELYGSFRSRRQEPVNIRPLITPENVRFTGEPIIFAEFPKDEAQAILTRQTTTNGRDVWLASGNSTMTIYNGILVGTRGTGNDLMNVDTGEVLPAIRGQRATATRVNRYMNGLGQIVAVPFVCDYAHQASTRVEIALGTYPASKIVESCAGQDYSFENTYWYTPSGKPRKTRSWVSPEVGYVDIEFLTN